MKLVIYDVLSGTKRQFVPIKEGRVTMYVCGPTVYSVPHLGNIRSCIVYDLIYRVLKRIYKDVTYIRNITDVDDKIIGAARQSKVSCEEISKRYEKIFHEHLLCLACLSPTYEPRATENIDVMISMIDSLIKSRNAYVVNGSVYFDITTFGSYGELSRKKISDLIHGSRVDIDSDKRNPGDFVLWKADDDVYWDSPWGKGRPGWHIECSAMSFDRLGADFDIHGGGADLKFPHHENEIAQSRCANPGSGFARYWIHNGFLTVEGEKMSKSIGNVLNLDKLISEGITPNTIRFILLSTHYSKPLDWHSGMVREAVSTLLRFKMVLLDNDGFAMLDEGEDQHFEEFFSYLCDDFNSPGAMSVLHSMKDKINASAASEAKKYAMSLNKMLKFIGIDLSLTQSVLLQDEIQCIIKERAVAKQSGDFKKADKLRNDLSNMGVTLRDIKDSETKWIAL